MATISKKHVAFYHISIDMLSLVRLRGEKRKRCRKERMWVAPHIKESNQRIAFQNHVLGLREHGKEVSPNIFDWLLALTTLYVAVRIPL